MGKPIVRNAFSSAMKVYNDISGQPSRVKREFKQETDINYIVGRWKKGINPPMWMTSKTPRYGDFSNMPQSLMESFQIVQDAKEAFDSLPLEFRRALDHDPRNLDKAPRELFEKHGLLKPSPEASGAPQGASGATGSPEGAGERVLPKKRPPGANKGVNQNPVASEEEA